MFYNKYKIIIIKENIDNVYKKAYNINRKHK